MEEEDLIDPFKENFADNPRLHGHDLLSGGSKRHRICDYKQLRELNDDFKSQGKKLISYPCVHVPLESGRRASVRLDGLLATIKKDK